MEKNQKATIAAPAILDNLLGWAAATGDGVPVLDAHIGTTRALLAIREDTTNF